MSSPPHDGPKKPYHKRLTPQAITTVVGSSVAVVNTVGDELRQEHRQGIDTGIFRLFQEDKGRVGFSTADLARLLGRHRRNAGTILRSGQNGSTNATNARVAAAARYFALQNLPVLLPRQERLDGLAELLRRLIEHPQLVTGWTALPAQVTGLELAYAVHFFVAEHEQNLADLHQELFDGGTTLTPDDLRRRREQVFSWIGITPQHLLWETHLQLGRDSNRWRVLYLGLRLP